MLFRSSPEAMIYFLGDTQWWRWSRGNGCGPALARGWPYYYMRQRNAAGVVELQPRTLLAMDKACGTLPITFRTFVQTHFNDADYYLLRQEDAADNDRSL